MKLRTLQEQRLVLVTGKGGTGKSSLASALGRMATRGGKRAIVVEVDSFRPALTAMFGRAPAYAPVDVGGGLFIANLSWREALVEWLADTVTAERIVKLILGNRVVQPFLEATPGLKELVILSRIIKLTHEYDQVIVDMPASGHAISLVGVPNVAIDLMRSGPIRVRAEAILKALEAPTTRVVIVALPEEMVVNETVELWERLRKEVRGLQPPLVVLNRAAVPSLADDEQTLLQRLTDREAALPEGADELLLAGRWEAGLENATADALARLDGELPDSATVVSLSRLGALGGQQGGPQRVVEQMVSALARIERQEGA